MNLTNSHIRLVVDNAANDNHELSLPTSDVWSLLDIVNDLSACAFSFNDDGTVTLIVPPVVYLPDDRPPPVYPVPGSFGAA